MSILRIPNVYKTMFFFFYLGASTANPFPQDHVYPPADLPSKLHRDNWRTIRTRQSRGNRVQDWYNYRLNSLNMGELVGDVERIFQDQTTVFKLTFLLALYCLITIRNRCSTITPLPITTGCSRHPF